MSPRDVFSLVLSGTLFLFSIEIQAGERFEPPDCEYSVSFPRSPKTYKQHKATADGGMLPLYGAELTVSGGKALLRAECGSAEGYNLSQFTDQSTVLYMQRIAMDYGLFRPNFETTTNTLGRVGTLTGFKDTEQGRMTVRVINYIGASSIMTLYIAALSRDFQTPEMRNFLASIRRK